MLKEQTYERQESLQNIAVYYFNVERQECLQNIADFYFNGLAMSL